MRSMARIQFSATTGSPKPLKTGGFCLRKSSSTHRSCGGGGGGGGGGVIPLPAPFPRGTFCGTSSFLLGRPARLLGGILF